MKICFASKDGVHVDEHFGWCQNFYMYSLDVEGFCFIKAIDSSRKIEKEGEKLLYKIKSLQDAQIVCVTQIGPKASNMVRSAGIYPLQAKEGEKIEDVLKQLQARFKNPPLWLKQIKAKDELCK